MRYFKRPCILCCGLALLLLTIFIFLSQHAPGFAQDRVGSASLTTSPAIPRIPLHDFAPAHTGDTLSMFVDTPINTASLSANDTGAKFEPVYGCYIGAYLDSALNLDAVTGAKHQPISREEAFGQLVGKPLASSFVYVNYGEAFPKKWGRQMAALGIAPHLAMEPNDGLEQVKDNAYLQQFAQDCAACGMPIFLRFASEMNGDWVAYHQAPALYIAKFRLVHDVMARYAPNVAMLWCVFTSPENNIPDYYPGDAYVDWVGVNVYNVFYHNNSRRNPGWQEHPVELLDYVYRHYANRKPIAIAEYGATHYDTVDHAWRGDFACAKLAQLLTALPIYYPRVKLLDFFECNNVKYAAPGRRLNDYSVTDDEWVLQTTKLGLSSNYYLSHVSTDRQPIPPTVMPTRVTDSMVLGGTIHLTAWLKSNVFHPTVIFSVDGQDIDRSKIPGNYQATIDTTAYPSGSHRLRVAVYDQHSARKNKLFDQLEVDVIFTRLDPSCFNGSQVRNEQH